MAQVIGAVSRVATDTTVVMCAAGTMPGALQILWRAAPGGYHMEYGYSCIGYEDPGTLGIKLAAPEKEVICFVGDGSYMMANSELATAVMMRVPFTIVLTNSRGYVGSASACNLNDPVRHARRFRCATSWPVSPSGPTPCSPFDAGIAGPPLLS